MRLWGGGWGGRRRWGRGRGRGRGLCSGLRRGLRLGRGSRLWRPGRRRSGRRRRFGGRRRLSSDRLRRRQKQQRRIHGRSPGQDRRSNGPGRWGLVRMVDLLADGSRSLFYRQRSVRQRRKSGKKHEPCISRESRPPRVCVGPLITHLPRRYYAPPPDGRHCWL